MNEKLRLWLKYGFLASIIFVIPIFQLGCSYQHVFRGNGVQITTKDFLLKNKSEDKGYALYSYVLFSHHYTNLHNEFGRYLQLYRDYKNILLFSSETGGVIPKNQTNITYWPVTFKTLSEVKKYYNANDTTNDSIFVNHYDYGKAKLLLKNFKNLREDGIFILVSRIPLTKVTPNNLPAELLVIDLTNVNENAFAAFLTYFQTKAKDDPTTWHNGFDMERLEANRINFIETIKIYGPVLKEYWPIFSDIISLIKCLPQKGML